MRRPWGTRYGLESLLAAARRLPSLAALSLHVQNEASCDIPLGGASLFVAPAEQVLPPLRHLVELELGGDAAALAAGLLQPGAATALTALRSLSLNFGGMRPRRRLKELWRAPFLPQLTRLELDGLGDDDNAPDDAGSDDGATDDMGGLFGALPDLGSSGGGGSGSGGGGGGGGGGGVTATPLLRCVKQLAVRVADDGRQAGLKMSKETLRRLLAACNPETLAALSLAGCEEGAVAARAARASYFTALRRLRLHGLDFSQADEWGVSDSDDDGHDDDEGEDGPPDDGERYAAAEAWRAMQAAPFAPLESLDIARAGWLLRRPERLQALLAAPWAASLVELALAGGDGKSGYGRGYDCSPLKPPALAALAALPQLRCLRLGGVGLEAAALEGAAARDLAARLAELSITALEADASTLAALGRLPFSARLEQLAVTLPEVELTLAELEAFGAAGAVWLARLARLQLSASHKTDEEVWEAALEPDGPLRALHRGGGELVLLPNCQLPL